jgi:hypothetical protein
MNDYFEQMTASAAPMENGDFRRPGIRLSAVICNGGIAVKNLEIMLARA